MTRPLPQGDKANESGKVVVVIPALNEEQSIGVVLDEVKEALQSYPLGMVVVDGQNGSTDRTAYIASSRGAHVIRQPGMGYGDALQSGFQYACDELGAQIIVMMDADATYRGEDLAKMVNQIVMMDADLVIGNRFADLKKGSMTMINRIGNRILSLLAKKCLSVEVSDTQCGLRVLRADSWRRLDIRETGMAFAIEMIAQAEKAGCRILEVPIGYYPRIGVSKLSPFRDGFRILVTILRLSRR
jgi:glycosyltransferase involved in cell wall biosynthesis